MNKIMARLLYEPVRSINSGFYAWIDPTEDSFPILHYLQTYLKKVSSKINLPIKMDDSTKLHVTLMYHSVGESLPDLIDLPRGLPKDQIVYITNPSSLTFFGKHLVLLLDSPELHEIHEQLRNLGFHHSFRSFQPHLTLGKTEDGAGDSLRGSFLDKVNETLRSSVVPLSLGPQLFCAPIQDD